eukprot:5252389-Alexandrium_andersonii.AAC.1
MCRRLRPLPRLRWGVRRFVLPPRLQGAQLRRLPVQIIAYGHCVSYLFLQAVVALMPSALLA